MPIMTQDRKQKSRPADRRRTLVLTAAAFASLLIAAGHGLVASSQAEAPPMPGNKPAEISAETLLRATPASFATPTVHVTRPPLPPVKPAAVAALSDAAATETDVLDALAPALAAIAPAAFGPPSQPAAAPADIPAKKTERRKAEKTARAFPALSARSGLLPDRDATLYRKAFDAQRAGDWAAADAALSDISDDRLRGHVLFQRYMHPSYKARFDELQHWMATYADHPGAPRLHKLAVARAPAGARVDKPETRTGIGAGTLHTRNIAQVYTAKKSRSAAQKRAIGNLVKAVHGDIGRGAPTRALRRMNADPATKMMDHVEYDQLRGQIANGYLLMGKPNDARTLARESAGRSGEKAPMAGWAGGLAAWLQKDYHDAARMFEYTARSPYVSPWMRAAGAYWASRAHMRAGNMKEVSHWLKEAASHPRTFYGLVATRALGLDFDFDWSMPEFTAEHRDALMDTPAGARAMALVEAGQNHLAEAELLQINPKDNELLQEAMVAYTQAAHLPSLSLRLANNFKRPDGGMYDAALYPLLPWEPKGGYTVDRALIHAIARQESRFDTAAKSTSGALGLMQVMPSTAGYIMETPHFKENAGKYHLTDPQVNLEIGQKYVDYLLDHGGVNKDLLSLAVAYNAGPGNLRKWQRELADGDPLLFIEIIPMAETRNYVERVIANYWIYAMRLGQDQPTLDMVVEGKQASYIPQDGPHETRLAQMVRPFRIAAAQ